MDKIQVVKCKRCGRVTAEPKELMRIQKSNVVKHLMGCRSSGIQSKILPQVIKMKQKR
jgi:hypothetical protein